MKCLFSTKKFILNTAVICAFGVAGSAIADTVTYTESGTFSVPSGVTDVTVYAWGAGGGGASNNSQGRAGGGGGAFAARMSVPVTPGNSYNVNVGLGGIAGSPNGSPGGASSFSGDAGVSVIADGGKGGANLAGGLGGSVASSTGDAGLVFAGGNGGNGFINAGGGGGAGAGTQANGLDGAAGLGVTGGAGGVGAFQGGSGAKGGDFMGSAGIPNSPGGGGGGIGRWGGSASNGATGIVVVSYESTTDVAYSGQVITPAMGLASGGTVYRPMPSTINQSGKVSFKLYLKPQGAINAANDTILVSNSSGSLKVLAQEGFFINPNEFLKGLFTGINLTDSGQTFTTELYYSNLTGKNGHSILSSPDGVSLDLVARQGDVLPDGSVRGTNHGRSVFDSEENYYFLGLLTNISNKRNSGIWRVKPNGDVEEVTQARKGYDLSTVLGRPAWTSTIRPALTAGGSGVSFVALLQGNPDNSRQRTDNKKNEIAMVVYNNGSSRAIIQKGDEIAQLGATIKLIPSVSRSEVDTHSVLVHLNAPVPATQNQALLFENQGNIEVIAQRGVTPIIDSLTINRFDQFYTTNNGAVVFRGLLNTTKDKDEVVCRWTQAGGIEVLAREGSPAPGTGGLNFGLLARMSVSPNGNIALQATLGSKKWGIFKNTGSGFLPVVRTGDLINHAGVNRPALAVSIGYESFSVYGGGGGLGESINNSGQVAVSLSLGNQIHINRVYQ